MYYDMYAAIYQASCKHVPKRRKNKKLGVPRHRRILMRHRRKIQIKHEMETDQLTKQRLMDESAGIEQQLLESHRMEASRTEIKAIELI